MFKKLLLLTIMLLPALMFADSNQEKGIELTKIFWRDAKSNNVRHVKKYIIHNFQGVNFSRVFNKDQKLAECQDSTITFYTLSNFVVTRSENVLMVTYMADFSETYQGITLSGSAPRMTTWQKIGHQWKLISHVSLARPNVT